jgi:hypothetical protein
MTRKFRPTIWSAWTKKAGKPKVMSITDNLTIGKVQFSGSEQGNGSVRAYIGQTKALALANAILNGTFSSVYPYKNEYNGMKTSGRFAVYGGAAKSSMYQGKPESRVVEISQVADTDQKGKARLRFKIDVRVGEGILGDQGQIMPKDSKNMISQFQFISVEQAYEMASMLKLHIESYYAMYLAEQYDEKGDPRKSGAIDDIFKAEFRQGNDEAPSTSGSDSSSDDIPLM